MNRNDLITEIAAMQMLGIAPPEALERARSLSDADIEADFQCMQVSEAADLLVSLVWSES